MKEFLYYFATAREKSPLGILLAGVTYPHGEYGVLRERAKVNVLEYVIRGSGFVEIDGVLTRVSAGTVYLLPQGHRHHYYADEKDPFEKIFLNVSGSFFEELLHAYGLSEKRFFQGEETRSFFLKIPEILSSSGSEEEKQALLQGVLVAIISRLSLARGLVEHSEEAIRMKAFLDRNLDRVVTTKELAGELYRSPDFCLKLFKKEFGTTPYAYQLSAKMEKAKALLSDTSLSIGQIAEALGYGDLHYFSNLFYQKCGVRPRAYRQKKTS